MTLRINSLIALLLVALLTIAGAALFASDETPAAGETKEKAETVVEAEAVETVVTPADRVVVYYLHGTRRCPTCMKLEAYSKEAIESGFADQLKSGAVEWRVVNFEEEGNEHFVDDYQLYTKTVILSRLEDGKETEYKNLDKIWELVGDKDKFLAYVTDETNAFLAAEAEAEAEAETEAETEAGEE